MKSASIALCSCRAFGSIFRGEIPAPARASFRRFFDPPRIRFRAHSAARTGRIPVPLHDGNRRIGTRAASESYQLMRCATPWSASTVAISHARPGVSISRAPPGILIVHAWSWLVPSAAITPREPAAPLDRLPKSRFASFYFPTSGGNKQHQRFPRSDNLLQFTTTGPLLRTDNSTQSYRAIATRFHLRGLTSRPSPSQTSALFKRARFAPDSQHCADTVPPLAD